MIRKHIKSVNVHCSMIPSLLHVGLSCAGQPGIWHRTFESKDLPEWQNLLHILARHDGLKQHYIIILTNNYDDTLHQQATGIEELVIYLESEVWEEGLPSYQRRKIWEFHEVPRFPKAFQLYSWPLIQKHKEHACMLIKNKEWETLSIIRPNMNRGRRGGWS